MMVRATLYSQVSIGRQMLITLGQQYSGIVMLGKHIFVNEVTITPLISLQATHLQVNGYTEKDAGDINLRVDSQDYKLSAKFLSETTL